MAGSESEAMPPCDHHIGIYTETLARLYLAQGFVEHALAIYRRLVQEQPGNQTLHERLHTLEQQLALGAPGSVVPVLPQAPLPVADPVPMATQHQEHQVVAQLERWLH